jgi:hypothetical protein
MQSHFSAKQNWAKSEAQPDVYWVGLPGGELSARSSMESGRKEALGVVGRSKSAPAKAKGPTAPALEAKESLQVW